MNRKAVAKKGRRIASHRQRTTTTVATPNRPKRRGTGRKLHLPVSLVALAMILAGALLIYAFTRGGSSAAGLATLTTSDFHSLAIHPRNPDVAFFGHHNGILRTEDGGRTWQETRLNGRNQDAMGMAISPSNPGQMYAAGHNVFFVSGDGSNTWQSLRHDLPGTDIHGFAMDQDNADILYAFVVGYGIFRSSNAGGHWQFVSSTLPMDVMSLASAGGDVLYAGSMERGILKSGDGGKTWVSANTGLEGRNIVGLAVDPTSPQNVYVGSERGLFKSTNAGGSWGKLPFPGSNASVIAIAPSNQRVVMVITVGNDRKGYVYRSEDGGQNWVS